jgi:hypothetical protein
MASPIKQIPVNNKDQALTILNALSNQYQMTAPDPDRPLEVSNEDYKAYYDPEKRKVILEAAHSSVTEEQIKEFLINFPPFF